MKSVVDIIEETHPKRAKADQVIVVTRLENSKRINKIKHQDKVDKKKIKTDDRRGKKRKIEEQERYKAFADTKEQCIKTLIKEYGIKRQEIENYAGYYQNRCKHLNKNIMMSCGFQGGLCTVFFTDCLYNHQFLRMLENERRKRLQFKIEPISMVAKRYNTTEDNVKSIAGTLRSQCPNYKNGKCSYERIPLTECSLQHSVCIFHSEFLTRMKKHSEKILQRQKKQSGIIVQEEKISNKNKCLLPEIGLRDFVVRTNVFKCMHNKHKIDNVDALMNLDIDGKVQQIRVSAGYCSQCKVYFILDSTYQNLKRKGIILCRVSDEKAYAKNGYVNEMHLAQESLLMQYGYSVSQMEDLSSTRRQKILAILIDNGIMSKSEIISYLDFFIRQRSSDSRMEIAISKWETDREFVEEYRRGHYTKFGVNAIYRR